MPIAWMTILAYGVVLMSLTLASRRRQSRSRNSSATASPTTREASTK